jgi:hypothetical protein
MDERRLEKLAVGGHCAVIFWAGSRKKNVLPQAGREIQSGADGLRFDSEGQRDESSAQSSCHDADADVTSLAGCHC